MSANYFGRRVALEDEDELLDELRNCPIPATKSKIRRDSDPVKQIQKYKVEDRVHRRYFDQDGDWQKKECYVVDAEYKKDEGRWYYLLQERRSGQLHEHVDERELKVD